MNDKEQQPIMTTVAGRPTKVGRLNTTRDVYVQCRLATGEDVWVPLDNIFTLFERQLVQELRSQG